MKITPLDSFALVALCIAFTNRLPAAEPDRPTPRIPPIAKLTLDLKRGICIDRQFRQIPPEPIMRITPEDIRLIQSMGFDSVKLIVNPEPLMCDGRLNSAKSWYLRDLVDLAANEGIPVVFCIHPEWEFKTTILSNRDEFDDFLVFLKEISQFLAARWSPHQLALQLMTEPGGNKLDWNDLQLRMWQTVRSVMPEHTLILAGDQVGKIEGLITVRPVDDDNVAYSFTFYDPFVLTLQGAEWLTPKLWAHLQAIPYPATPELVTEQLPSILARIPATPEHWRPAAKRMVLEYGNARWNRATIAARVKQLADWNDRHGGKLRIWCAEFGCYQRTIGTADRYRYIRDVREIFDEHEIGWAYWSYNETLTVMTADRQPFGPANQQTPDQEILKALLADRINSTSPGAPK